MRVTIKRVHPLFAAGSMTNRGRRCRPGHPQCRRERQAAAYRLESDAEFASMRAAYAALN